MKYNFKFSIIISYYNTEEYLKKCIDSIINQTMDFETNIQLILIDDGSTDLSREIAKKYYLKYENIVFLTQEHKGVAYARNHALNFATGKYISFLDSDDYISKNALQEIYDTFEKKYDEIDFITIPSIYFENVKDKINYTTSEKSGIIDLTKNPNNPIIDISSVFFKSEILQNLKFETSLIHSEDTLLLNQILINKMKYYAINTAKYFKRNRFDLKNKLCEVISKKEYYADRLKNFHLKLIEYCLNEKNEIPKFIQYTVIYDLLKIIKQPEINIFYDETEMGEFYKYLKRIMLNIDDEIILNNKYLDETLKSYFLYIKYEKISYKYENTNILMEIGNHVVDQLNNHTILFEKIDMIQNNLFVSGVIYTLFNPKNISISAINEKNGEKHYFKCSYLKNGHENIKFLSKDWVNGYSFDLILPIKELMDSELTFQINYHKNNDTGNFDSENIICSKLNCKLKKLCNISDKKNTIFKNSLKIKFDKNTIFVTKAYKFSVVMAIYNTQNYVKDAIDSVIQQDIGFKENIQLILVDDGSTDNTPQILLEYKNKYPENIIILTQKNQGQSTARNNGIEYIQGKYVNFLDSDDLLSLDAMSEAYNFLEENYDEIDFVSIKQKHFGRKNTGHMLNFRFDEGTRIIDLIEEPNNPQLASNAVFFKEHLFRTYKFPTNVISSEDAILVNKILMEKKKYGVLENPIYYYRKRDDFTSTIDTISVKKEFFTEKLKNYYMELINYSLEKEGKVLEFIQYLCAYDLQWLIAAPDLDVLNSNEKEEFWRCLEYVISNIDYEIIAFNRTVNTRPLRNFFIYLKNKEMHVETTANNVSIKSNRFQFDDLASHNMWIDITTIQDNTLYISGHVDSYFDLKHLSFGVLKKNKNKDDEYFLGKYVKYTSREHLTYLSKEWNFVYNFDFEIPLKENDESIITVLVNYHKNGDNTNFDKENLFTTDLNIKFPTYGPFSKINNYKVQNSRILFFKNNKFYVHKYSYKSMLKHELEVLSKIIHENKHIYFESIFLRISRMITYPFLKNKKIYLFIDRGNEAGDNAMHLFKHASSIDDNIKKYMVVSKENSEYKKLSKIGNVVDNNSIKHKFIYFFADKIISTHPYHTIVNPFFLFGKNNKRHFTGLNDYKLYFLQHGVTKDNISSWFSKFDKNVSLISTVSDKERESFLEEGYGYDEKVINTLGFPRFDALKKSSTTKKQILIIPTWRKDLKGSKDKFIKSEYFKSLNELLNNKELLELINKKGYELIFKPHPELNKKINGEERYIDLFNIPEEIEIPINETYEELFKNASLMITDYSSVFFDFAYMKKPVIYYQPNNDYHYEKSYFDYETMGFGEVISEEQTLVRKIREYLENDCIMENKYKNNVDNFFKYNDDKNCERVYDWIKKN